MSPMKPSQAAEGAIRYGRSPYAAWRGEPLTPLGRSMLQLVAAAWRAGHLLSLDQLWFDLVEQGHALEDVRETHAEFFARRLLLLDRSCLVPGVGALIELGDAEAEADLGTLAKLVSEIRRSYRPDLRELPLATLATALARPLDEVRRFAALVPTFQEERGIVLSVDVLAWGSFSGFLAQVLRMEPAPEPAAASAEFSPMDVQLGFLPSKVQWTNLGPYEHATLELAPFTVLVGGNGVGKTSALQVLALCSRLGDHGLSLFEGWSRRRDALPPFAPPGMVRDGCKEFSLQVTGEVLRRSTRWKTAQWGVTVENSERAAVLHESVGELGERPEAELEVGVGDWLAPGGQRAPLLLRPNQLALARAEDPMLHPAAISIRQSLERWSIGTDLAIGVDRAGQYVLLEPRDDPDRQVSREFNEVLGAVLGGYKLIAYPRHGGMLAGGMLADPRGRKMPVAHAPSGVQRVIEIFTELLRPTPPSLLAIDELETHLHADVIGRLIDVLRSFTDRTRIVVTTHSASVLRAARVDEVRVIRSGVRASVIERADRDPLLRELVQTCSMDELLGLGAFAGPP